MLNISLSWFFFPKYWTGLKVHFSLYLTEKPKQTYWPTQYLLSLDIFYCCCCLFAKLYPTLCDPMDCSMPGPPVLHPLPELTYTHVHWVGYAIQPSRPLLSPSLPASNLSQHQGLFQWVGSLHQVARVLELQASTSVLPMNIQDWFPLGLTGLISLQSKGLSRVFSKYGLGAW